MSEQQQHEPSDPRERAKTEKVIKAKTAATERQLRASGWRDPGEELTPDEAAELRRLDRALTVAAREPLNARVYAIRPDLPLGHQTTDYDGPDADLVRRYYDLRALRLELRRRTKGDAPWLSTNPVALAVVEESIPGLLAELDDLVRPYRDLLEAAWERRGGGPHPWKTPYPDDPSKTH